jgi:hypothetical protein
MEYRQRCGEVLMKMSKEWEFWWTYLVEYREGKAHGEEWKMAVVCPIYKNNGNVREPSNYIGVSLLRAVGVFSPVFWPLD